MELSVAEREKTPEIPTLKEELPHNQAYLKHHATAWTEICAELDAETRREYQALVQEWNNNRVPREVQQRLAHPIQI